MRLSGLAALLLVACGGKTTAAPEVDAASDGEIVSMIPPTPGCTTVDKVGTCPTDTPCMAAVKQGPIESGRALEHRIGRLRLWKPDSVLPLTGILIDPNVRARCANAGTEALSWLFRVDRGTSTFTTGMSRPSADGKTFSFVEESAGLEAACPELGAGPIGVAPATAVLPSSQGVDVRLPSLALTIFRPESTTIFPLRDVAFFIPTFGAAGSCVGSFDPDRWCDGDSEGWTTNGRITAKISLEDADTVPIPSAGCQTLCAILVNDATKTEGRRCRRVDGRVPEWGDACIGGGACKNALHFEATFASYGVDIVP